MNKSLYRSLTDLANHSHLPCVIYEVEKKADGTCGYIRIFAVNDIYKKSFLEMFVDEDKRKTTTLDDVEKMIIGKSYTEFLPKEPNFEEIVFKGAWEGKHTHTYVDTTHLYGLWTEDIIFPVVCEHEPNVAYCQFMYTLNTEMDTGKYGTVPPDISSFVIKTCLEINNDNDFYTSMDIITKDIRSFCNSFSTCIMTVDTEHKSFDVISEDVRNNELCIKDIFSEFPYEIVGSWENLVKDTDNIIIKDENDMNFYEAKAYDWAQTLKKSGVQNLCLFPFLHHGMIIGYLFSTNFDANNITRIQETIGLIAFFLSAEIANHTLFEQLEYLSTIDSLTGVYNRNCMNVNVDELSIKLKFEPKPYGVAFFDLNGLKSINDNGGHNAGDDLLKDAAKVLKTVFSDDNIYRAGGDEFVVIALNTSEDVFLEKITKVRELAHDPDWLNFAIGHHFDDSTGNLRLAMRYADENMYEDKKAYYEAHPEKRR